jgi:hypothetical protein
MTNRYLEKIAASMQDEKDAAKTFAKSSVSGFAGHAAGAIIGGTAGAILGSKSKGVRAFSRRMMRKGTSYKKQFDKTGLGKVLNKHTMGGGATGIVGGIVGGHAVEEASNYAATRQGVLESKRNARKEK